MSENALKRIAIVMAREDDAFKPSQRLSAGVIRQRLSTAFPRQSYNFTVVKLYLYRLFQNRLVQPSQRGGPPMYQLTELGYAEAQKYWESREELGYVEPPRSETPATAGEVIPAAV